MSVGCIEHVERLLNELWDRQKNLFVGPVADDDNSDKEFGRDSGDLELLV